MMRRFVPELDLLVFRFHAARRRGCLGGGERTILMRLEEDTAAAHIRYTGNAGRTAREVFYVITTLIVTTVINVMMMRMMIDDDLRMVLFLCQDTDTFTFNHIQSFSKFPVTARDRTYCSSCRSSSSSSRRVVRRRCRYSRRHHGLSILLEVILVLLLFADNFHHPWLVDAWHRTGKRRRVDFHRRHHTSETQMRHNSICV
mmetsp:Transcript_34513/g.83292  ORF Transcript_34513/g.83292 Transcript_34513/m.83292 type:complete len:201 (-) Transcript_34513:211-813(-)